MTPRPRLFSPATYAKLYGIRGQAFLVSTVLPVRATFTHLLGRAGHHDPLSWTTTRLLVFRDGANNGRHTPEWGGASDALASRLLTFLVKSEAP